MKTKKNGIAYTTSAIKKHMVVVCTDCGRVLRGPCLNRCHRAKINGLHHYFCSERCIDRYKDEHFF